MSAMVEGEVGGIEVAIRLPNGIRRVLAFEVLSIPPLPGRTEIHPRDLLSAWEAVQKHTEETIRLYGADGLMEALRDEQDEVERPTVTG